MDRPRLAGLSVEPARYHHMAPPDHDACWYKQAPEPVAAAAAVALRGGGSRAQARRRHRRDLDP